MGDHSDKADAYPPGTAFSPTGEPVGPASDTSTPDVSGYAPQDPGYAEAEDLQPDLSLWDAAVVEVR